MSDSSESSDSEYSEDASGGDEDVPDNVEEWTDFEEDTDEAVENILTPALSAQQPLV